MMLCLATGAHAQQNSPPAMPTYAAPVLQLVQPPSGAGVPAEHPVVVFRFIPGEPSDQVDVTSFRIWVDGVDRSQLFQIDARVGGGDAWGPLFPYAATVPSDSGAVATAPAGVHLVTARICSVRGVCGSVNAPVTIQPPDVPDADSGSERKGPSLRHKLLELLLDGARKLLIPGHPGSR